MSGPSEIEVEIAYATAEQQTLLRICVAPGIDVQGAIQHSGILRTHPEIDLTRQSVGIFGQRVALTAIPKNGDRIEIYRPLIIDPKQARRHRAQLAEQKPRRR